MSRVGQVWAEVRADGAFVIVWPLGRGWRILWVDGRRAGTLDAIDRSFTFDSGWWKQIA